jgi:hypothetical protein
MAKAKPKTKKNTRLQARLETIEANLNSLFADTTVTEQEMIAAFETIRDSAQTHIDMLKDQIDYENEELENDI